MDATAAQQTKTTLDARARREAAVRQTAPGTALRMALDMIIDGHLGALICIGDTENVLAAGDSGFKLDVSFTANRLFELCKMDGAVIIDKDLTQILRANYHLNPDPSLPTTETGTRHRTAARMSLLTGATVISVSERRSVVNVYVDGKGFQLRPVQEVMAESNQLLTAMLSSRTQLDRRLVRLSSLEFDNSVTLSDITSVFYLFETLLTEGKSLDACILELGREAKATQLQRDELLAGVDDMYTLTVRDYARDSSEENAATIRSRFSDYENAQLRSPKRIGELLGFDDLREDSVMRPLGLRTLSRVSVVREGVADQLLDEYGSLQEVLEAVEDDPKRLEEVVNNPDILAAHLHRIWDRGE